MTRPASLFERLLLRAKLADYAFLVTVAVVIGCLGGFGAVFFRKLIGWVQRVAWGQGVLSLDLVRSHPWWWVVLTPAVGGLVVGPLVYFFAREAKGHGVPEVMEAVAVRAGVIRPRLVVVKTLASAISIGTGGSVGREGPIVQIGSALGSTIGQWLRVSGRRLRTLVGCGAAAGIAATFNAPIAGALFAVEVILGDFAVARFSPARVGARDFEGRPHYRGARRLIFGPLAQSEAWSRVDSRESRPSWLSEWRQKTHLSRFRDWLR